MTMNLSRKTISSAKLIQLINDSREQEARASGIAFPSKNFGFVDQEAIRHNARKLGITHKSSTLSFSQPDAQEIAFSYGPIANCLVADFFHDQDMPIDVVAKEVQIKPVQSSTAILPSVAGNESPTTMSSREIAALTGKRHDNVAADIKKMLNELGEDVLKFQDIYLDTQNRKQTEYHLDRELTDTLLTGYSSPLRRKVIARWHELEAQQASPIEQKLALLVEQGKKLEEQNKKLEAAVLRISAEIEAIKVAQPAPVVLQQPTSEVKRRTKNPKRVPGPLVWQIGKKTKSIRFNFSIAPHEIGLERFYLHLYGLKTEAERADALRAALHLGIKLDNALPLNFPPDAKSIRFKVGFSEEKDRQLQDVLEMLYPLATDKDRRIAIKRYLVNKSSAAPQTFTVSVTPAQSHPNQPGLF